MDKQKLIEEMADIIKSVTLYGDDNYRRVISNDSCMELAEKLLTHYQPKLPEGSEVVDRKVLEMFQKDEEKFREKAKFYYEKCKSYGIENFYDPELEYVDD